jgi:hypothetical protein
MPQRANWPLAVIKEELEAAGIYLLEEFPDGQTRWGTEPLIEPYGGSFTMASEFEPGKSDIFQVQAIMTRLDKSGHIHGVSENLYRRINEGLE